MEALSEVVQEDGYFENADSIVSNSMLAPIQKVFTGTETLFKNVDLKNSSSEIKRFFINKAKELIRDGVFQEERIYILNKFDNFMLSNITQATRINGVMIKDMANELFRGDNSLPKVILELQNSGETNNLLIDNLLPMLDPHEPSSFKSTIDNLKLVARKYDSYDLDQLTFAMQELKETNPDVYNKLLLFSILQSGFDFNPNSFKQIIPGKDILDITESAFVDVSKSPNFATRLPGLYDQFINNNWDNGRIVKQVYLYGDSAADVDVDYLPGNKFRGAKYVTAHARLGDKDSDSYQSTFFKLDTAKDRTTGEVDLSQSGYRKANKMGKRNSIIETGYVSIIPSNVNPAPYKFANFFGSAVSEKIVNKTKTIHLAKPNSKVKEGRYALHDGTKIKINKLKATTKLDVLMRNKDLLDMLDIKNKKQLATEAGYNDVAHMATVLGGFTKNTSRATVYQIVVEETGTGRFEQASQDLADFANALKTLGEGPNNESNNCG